jgi:hypothetical protein
MDCKADCEVVLCENMMLLYVLIAKMLLFHGLVMAIMLNFSEQEPIMHLILF